MGENKEDLKNKILIIMSYVFVVVVFIIIFKHSAFSDVHFNRIENPNTGELNGVFLSLVAYAFIGCISYALYISVFGLYLEILFCITHIKEIFNDRDFLKKSMKNPITPEGHEKTYKVLLTFVSLPIVIAILFFMFNILHL